MAMTKQDAQLRDFLLPVVKAVQWILGMQNNDGGWGAFDIHNDRLFLNKIPFSDMEALCDPSTADVTGRILEAFGLLCQGTSKLPVQLVSDMSAACNRAVLYLNCTREVPVHGMAGGERTTYTAPAMWSVA